MREKLKSFPYRKVLKWTIYFCLFMILCAWISNYWVIKSTRSQLYTEVKEIPENNVGLLLGASKTFLNGSENLYFKYRIEAASELFHAGKIKHIIVSGDNHKKEYDEATDMRDALIAQGVPDSCITLDYAGFRTLDSVVRCLKVFGQKNITIISQEFHNQRAVFIANKYGMNTVGFNAKDVPDKYSLRVRVREYFAKFKAVIDLYVIHKSPHFLGEEVKITI